LAVLQSEVPLQLFRPAHLTDMSPAAWAVVRGALMANRAAAVLARATADLNLDDMDVPLKVSEKIKRQNKTELQKGLEPWVL